MIRLIKRYGSRKLYDTEESRYVSLEELADILGEELELPRIEPKGGGEINERKSRYTTIHSSGPESLRHFKRTFRKALKRQIMSDTYDQNRPIIIPVRDDRVYRAAKPSPRPEANAVIFYGKGGDLASNHRDEQEMSVLCLRILQAALVYVNTLMLQDLLAEPDRDDVLTPEDRRGLTPLFWSHVLPYGEVKLDMTSRLPLSTS